jgi:hypothetical protein
LPLVDEFPLLSYVENLNVPPAPLLLARRTVLGLVAGPILNGLLLLALRLARLPGAVDAVTITTTQFRNPGCSTPFASLTWTAKVTWSPGFVDSDAVLGLGHELPVGDTHVTLSKTPSFSVTLPAVEQFNNNAY